MKHTQAHQLVKMKLKWKKWVNVENQIHKRISCWSSGPQGDVTCIQSRVLAQQLNPCRPGQRFQQDLQVTLNMNGPATGLTKQRKSMTETRWIGWQRRFTECKRETNKPQHQCVKTKCEFSHELERIPQAQAVSLPNILAAAKPLWKQNQNGI